MSKVCGDIFFVFEDIWSTVGPQALGRLFEPWSLGLWSKRVVLHSLLSTVCDDLLVAFEQAWAGVMVFAVSSEHSL